MQHVIFVPVFGFQTQSKGHELGLVVPPQHSGQPDYNCSIHLFFFLIKRLKVVMKNQHIIKSK